MALRRIYRKCLWFEPACAVTLSEIPVQIYSAHLVSGTDNVQRNSATGPVIRARSVSLCVCVLILQLVQSGFSQQSWTPPPPNMTDWWPADRDPTDIIGGQNETIV